MAMECESNYDFCRCEMVCLVRCVLCVFHCMGFSLCVEELVNLLLCCKKSVDGCTRFYYNNASNVLKKFLIVGTTFSVCI